jgi:hypothetical protein
MREESKDVQRIGVRREEELGIGGGERMIQEQSREERKDVQRRGVRREEVQSRGGRENDTRAE